MIQDMLQARNEMVLYLTCCKLLLHTMRNLQWAVQLIPTHSSCMKEKGSGHSTAKIHIKRGAVGQYLH